MTETEYLSQRVDDQINWFDQKSSSYKKLHMRLRALEIILALTIPVYAIFQDGHIFAVLLLSGISSMVVAAIASILTLYKFQENWIEYRAIAEALKYEKFLYLTRSGCYRNEALFPDFVERIEGILSKENARWSAQNKSQSPDIQNEEITN